MTPTTQDAAHRRASCEQCRQKKLKCDGGQPQCGRCVTAGEVCEYSARRPMGRPKKRKVQLEQVQPRDHSIADNTPPLSVEMDMPTELNEDMDLNGLELGPRIEFDSGAEQNVWGCDTNVSTDTDQTFLGLKPSFDKSSCSCLASIYLCLEETRVAETTSFSSGIARLRSVTERASNIIRCPVCPTQFVWAMQNSQLLNTLLASIAESFRRLSQSIDDEALRAENNNEMKTLFISETQSGISDPTAGNGTYSASGVPVSLTPAQWASFAKGVVKQEIFGSPSSASISFSALLELMEDRQLRWHSGALPSACPAANPHQFNSCDQNKEPLCVMLVRHTKDIVDRIQFNG